MKTRNRSGAVVLPHPSNAKKNNNKEKTQGERRGGLVTLAGAWGVVDPVEDDEWQAANHEDDSHD